MRTIGPVCGTLLCSGRNGSRSAVATLPDGEGGWYLVTSDYMTDPVNPPDGRPDIGLLRLGPDLLSRPVNAGPGGDDPCGALLVGGAGTQEPVEALQLRDGRYVVSGREIGADSTPWRVFAWGFDGAAAPTFVDPFVTPMPADIVTRQPRIAADGSGGFYLAWEQYPPPPASFKDIYLARYDGDGRALWPAPVRMTRQTTAWFMETIAADPAGGAWVVWVDRPPDAHLLRPQHYVQHARPDGATTLPAGGVLLDPTRDTDGVPLSALYALPGGVLAATSFENKVAVHYIGETGQRFWGAEGRVFRAVHLAGPSGIRILRAPDGSFRLIWLEEYVQGHSLAAARFEIDGTAPWPASVDLVDSWSLIRTVDVAFLADGTLVAVATTEPHPLIGAGLDLAAQAVDGRGRTKSTSGGDPVCALIGSDQAAARILPGIDATVRLFWSDNRAGPWPDDGTNYYTGAVAFTSMPTLAAVSEPIEMPQGASTTFMIDGDDLDPAAVIAPGDGIQVVSALVMPLSATGPGDRLVLSVRADPGAGVGARALVLTNPDGESAAAGAYLRITLDARRIDIDGSGRTDGFDLAVLASAFGRVRGEAGYKPSADIDGSGVVDGVDLAFIASRFGGPPQ